MNVVVPSQARRFLALVFCDFFHDNKMVALGDMANLDLNDFKSRVKRIQDPRNNAYYDQELGMHVPKHTTQVEIQKAVKARKFSVVRLLVSVLIGVFGTIAAQAIRVRYFELVETTQTALFTDLLLALFMVLLLSVLMRHRRVTLRLAQFAGVAAMIFAGHNLMWFYPDQMAVIYTTDYVAQISAETEPMSIVIPSVLVSPAS